MPLTLDDLAHALNMDTAPQAGTVQATEMQRALDAAVQEVTRATGMLDGTTVTVSVSAHLRERTLVLPYVRLAAIGTVTDPGGYVVAPWATDLRAGVIELGTPTSGGVWTVVVTGSAWPAALQLAVLDWATHLYDTQRTVTNPVSDPDQPAPSFALPNRVAEMIEPYRMAGIA